MNKAQALYSFWASFGWAAYDQTTTPEDAPMPRITYQVETDSFDNTLLLSASLWDKSTSWERISQKVEEISRAIQNMNPPSVAIDGGRMFISKGTPFAMRMADVDSSIRRIVLNINVEFMTQY